MSVTGTLRRLPLRELLDILRLIGPTGRLYLSAHDQCGVVILHEGRVIYAVHGSAGHLPVPGLTCKYPADPDADEAQLLSPEIEEELRSLAVLVQLWVITRCDREALLRHQTAKALQHLEAWKDGYFVFEGLPLPEWIPRGSSPAPAVQGSRVSATSIHRSKRISASIRPPATPAIRRGDTVTLLEVAM
jgi:hypothetical protein